MARSEKKKTTMFVSLDSIWTPFNVIAIPCMHICKLLLLIIYYIGKKCTFSLSMFFLTRSILVLMVSLSYTLHWYPLHSKIWHCLKKANGDRRHIRTAPHYCWDHSNKGDDDNVIKSTTHQLLLLILIIITTINSPRYITYSYVIISIQHWYLACIVLLNTQCLLLCHCRSCVFFVLISHCIFLIFSDFTLFQLFPW